MENYVPVINTKGRPLAPCHPRRAKSLVRADKARFQHRSGIRCVVLFKFRIPKLKHAAKLQLRLDPGSEYTGVAITRDHADGSRSVLMCFVIEHRGKAIKVAMLDRARHRSNRRYRKTPYRKPRFDNRTRSDEWLPPSILSRMQNTLTWVCRLSRLLPIDSIHIETAVFDPQVLRTPEIQGVEYQKGPLYQTNLRAAVFHRDGSKCAYCSKGGKHVKLELDHVVPKASGGADRYDNLVVACRACNQQKANQPLEAFLKRRPKKLAEIKAKLGQDLAPATHLNVILPRLIEELRAAGWTVVEHSAATTAAGRRTCGIEKSHHGDAAVTGCPTRMRYMPDAPIKIEATGRGGYQRIMPDQHGTPRGKGYRRYCRLPKHVQRQTPTPGHKKRAKRVDGIATGDYVAFYHTNSGRHIHGRGSISNDKVAITKPCWRSTKAKNATVLERNHGYSVQYRCKKVNFSRNGPSTASEVRVKRTAAPTVQGGSALESHQGTPS